MSSVHMPKFTWKHHDKIKFLITSHNPDFKVWEFFKPSPLFSIEESIVRQHSSWCNKQLDCFKRTKSQKVSTLLAFQLFIFSWSMWDWPNEVNIRTEKTMSPEQIAESHSFKTHRPVMKPWKLCRWDPHCPLHTVATRAPEATEHMK